MLSQRFGWALVIAAILVAIAVAGVFRALPVARADPSDYFVYSELDTGTAGSYGVDGYVGTDGVDRIIFYSGSTAYIYTVTIPVGADPNMHPDNPEATGPVAPRTFTFEKSFELGASCSHQCEFYVDADNDVIYFGATVGIKKYVYNGGVDNYVYDSDVAPPSPEEEGYGTQSLAYDPTSDIWYAGSIAWNNDPGVTLRDMWKYDGAQGSSGTWQLAFQYVTPEGGGSHHDGMEFINGYLWLADYQGDYIKQYTTGGSQVEVYWHEPLGHELEGMGYGALGHFWCGSHGSTITEFGGGALQHGVTTTPPPPATPTGTSTPTPTRTPTATRTPTPTATLPPGVGGVVNLPPAALESGGLNGDSRWSVGAWAALVGGIAAAGVAISVGGWRIRRRRLQ